MSKIKVMIADDIEETRNVIKKILSMEKENFEITGEASNGEEVLKLIPEYKPDVVLMDINMPIMNGLEATEKITEAFPSVIVIIMSVQAKSEYLKKAMFCGAKEYIIKPFNYNDLIDTITATYEKQKERAIYSKTYEELGSNGKVISFYSSKGGVGKSVLSINSAITLSKTFKKKTLLLDLDLQYGDISMLANQHNDKTILDIIDDGQLASYSSIRPYLYEHNKKLDILFAPYNPEKAEYISKDAIEKMVSIFKKHYEFIVIDTGINFNDSTLNILDTSDLVLFIANMEMTTLRDTKLGLSVMETLNYDSNKVKVVVNSVTGKYGLSKKDVQDVFAEQLFSMIPEDIKNVRLSVNRGLPLCDNNKNRTLKIVKAIQTMCQEVVRCL
ncbi:response regulator [Vallitalea okinawensis]|uniref:response regulator n=1 Tax=Vallitalea okinawensis TaxID=2078660 RepID=UPI000CFB427A|nr:response regulator [Vallitalea okinawensis]